MNLYFLFGTDGYRLRKRLDEIKKPFIEGGAGIVNIDAQEKWDPEALNGALVSMGLFDSRRLVIVKGIVKSPVDADWLIARLKNISADTTVVVVEGGAPDKRSKLYKMLSKICQTEVFEPLKGADWRRAAETIIAMAKININFNAKSHIIIATEGDGWLLENVIAQLQLYCGGRSIEQADIDIFVHRQPGGNSFQMLDAIAQNRIGNAYRQLRDLWRLNEEPVKVLGAIGFQYRSLALLKAAQEDGIAQNELARRTALHPFVVSKLSPLSRKYSWQWVGNVYGEISKIDEGIKSGKIEGETALELLVYNLSKAHTMRDPAQRIVFAQ